MNFTGNSQNSKPEICFHAKPGKIVPIYCSEWKIGSSVVVAIFILSCTGLHQFFIFIHLLFSFSIYIISLPPPTRIGLTLLDPIETCFEITVCQILSMSHQEITDLGPATSLERVPQNHPTLVSLLVLKNCSDNFLAFLDL